MDRESALLVGERENEVVDCDGTLFCGASGGDEGDNFDSFVAVGCSNFLGSSEGSPTEFGASPPLNVLGALCMDVDVYAELDTIDVVVGESCGVCAIRT